MSDQIAALEARCAELERDLRLLKDNNIRSRCAAECRTREFLKEIEHCITQTRDALECDIPVEKQIYFAKRTTATALRKIFAKQLDEMES